MGAIASYGDPIMQPDILRRFNIPNSTIEQILRSEMIELLRRERKFSHYRDKLDIIDKTILLVDDGAATGSTMIAALNSLKQFCPRKIVGVIPVASQKALIEIGSYCDEVICLLSPQPFYSVAQWYENFDQVSDDEVINLLR